jgi:hypothetical protein
VSSPVQAVAGAVGAPVIASTVPARGASSLAIARELVTQLGGLVAYWDTDVVILDRHRAEASSRVLAAI